MIEIAKVLKPQGLQGEIKVECFTHDLDFWRSLKNVVILNENFEVKSVRFYKDFGYLTLSKMDTIEKVEKFRNKIIFADEKNLQTDDDEFLIGDLESCEMVDENGKFVGVIESVEKYPTVDIINYMVGGARRSFPFLKKVIKKVDIKNKKLIVFKERLDEVAI
ncbi:MAG: 16S rRNA processing protein RimM [Clostridia bacterium]|nr:16S rRNA processing protein RimM [Clostridia bacterium]